MISGIITLTTDFGISDPYVGIMKGVILSINPEARIIDICHQIDVGALVHVSSLIQVTYHFFPEGTIHVVVVDPGVGGHRRPILVKTERYLFVGPDNGLFWPIVTRHESSEIIHIMERQYFLPNVSSTFHGRDIFASVAGHLSLGVEATDMGPAIDDPVPLELPRPRQRKGVLCGLVMRVDHFGNLITNIHRKDLEHFLGVGKPVIRTRGLAIEGLGETYGDVEKGEALALIGSADCLEIAVNLGRACDMLGVRSRDIIGMEVEVSRG